MITNLSTVNYITQVYNVLPSVNYGSLVISMVFLQGYIIFISKCDIPDEVVRVAQAYDELSLLHSLQVDYYHQGQD